MIDYLASFVNTDGASFPNTKSINASGPSATDGTEFVKLMIDDLWGFNQALMDYAGLTPDSVTEAPGTSQRLEALQKGLAVGPGFGVQYWKDGDPAVNGDRVLLLQGQGVLRANFPELDAAVYVGDPSNPTAPAFYHADDAAGTIRNTAGVYLILPDARGVYLRGDGTHGTLLKANGGAVVGPTFGGTEDDQIQGHYHDVSLRSFNTAAVTTADDSMCTADNAPVTVKNNDANLVQVNAPKTDGTNGAPRAGDETKGFGLSCVFGITY